MFTAIKLMNIPITSHSYLFFLPLLWDPEFTNPKSKRKPAAVCCERFQAQHELKLGEIAPLSEQDWDVGLWQIWDSPLWDHML